MSSLDQSFQTACKDGTLAGAVIIAADKSGIIHSKAYGLRSPKDPNSALKEDDILYTASCTKLLTSIAAMQCVERGLIRLEDDVTVLLPELGKLQVLTGFDDEGKPVLVDRTRPITLRNLLTHTAGLAYDSAELTRYRSLDHTEGTGENPTLTRFSGPLIFQPGTSWSYGTSLDWCGRLIERLTHQTLEEYMKSFIFTPLGIKDITFWPSKRPDLKNRLMSLVTRNATNGTLEECDLLPSFLLGESTECLGGQGTYAPMTEFFRVLQSLLLDDEKLLKKSTAARMFTPHLTVEEKNGMRAIQASPDGLAVWHEDVELDWGLCGILFLNDHMKIGMGKPTLSWSGAPNLDWFIDREVGVCGVYGVQVWPPVEAKAQEMRAVFQKGVYDIVHGRA